MLPVPIMADKTILIGTLLLTAAAAGAVASDPGPGGNGNPGSVAAEIQAHNETVGNETVGNETVGNETAGNETAQHLHLLDGRPLHGLCNAWGANERGREKGNVTNATAFVFLQSQAGDTSVETFCEDVPHPGDRDNGEAATAQGNHTHDGNGHGSGQGQGAEGDPKGKGHAKNKNKGASNGPPSSEEEQQDPL